MKVVGIAGAFAPVMAAVAVRAGRSHALEHALYLTAISAASAATIDAPETLSVIGPVFTVALNDAVTLTRAEGGV
jgi:hypothetical protein